MAVGKPLHLRLFLEGIEVPVVSAQVSINVNGPATAAIQVVPLDEAMALHPRTMVHLFFLDHIDSTLPPEDFKKNYKLLFCGETVGFSYVQTPMSRGLILQCLDFSSYWDAAHATAIEYGPGGNLFSNQAALVGSNTALFDDIINTQAEKLTQWLKSRPKTPGLESVTGLAGGIIHMLEQIGGVPKHGRGVNDFFTVAELRCRVLQQIAAEENDRTAANVLDVKVFMQWLKHGLQNMGQQVTFRDMMKLLFQYIYYESVPNPVAKYDDDVEKSRVIAKSGYLPLNQHPIAIRSRAELKEIARAISTAIQVSESRTAVSSGESGTILSEACLKNSIALDKIANTLKSIGSASRRPANDCLKASVELYELRLKLTGTESISLSSVRRIMTAAIGKSHEAISHLTNGLDPVYSSGRKIGGKLSRLKTQIIRPDCWFSAPPRCNVIFPEHFTQLSYDRLYIQEATRTLILTYSTLVGKPVDLPMLANDRVLAPNVGSEQEKILFGALGKGGYRRLMLHEYHTGIIPRSEWLANTSSFDSSRGTGNRGDRLSWAQKIALFHFFKYRFGPRQASVGGRFNPNVVCGFPALIVRRPYIIPGFSNASNALSAHASRTIQEFKMKSGETPPPSQLVGMVGSVAHSIDQNGGTTSMSLHHVRQTDVVDDDFLRIVLNEYATRKRTIRVALKADDATSIKLKKLLIGITPQRPASKRVTKSERQVVKKAVSVRKKSVLGGETSEDVTVRSSSEILTVEDLKSRVELGSIDDVDALVPSPPGKITIGKEGVYGKIVGIEVVDENVVSLEGGLAFSSVILHEEVTVPDVKVEAPIEEVLRPKFFSQNYASWNIGKKIYQPFFGCDSIIDEIMYDGAGAGEMVSPKDEADYDPDWDKSELIDKIKGQEKRLGQASIERAVNYIGYVYGVVKAQGKDVDDFVRNFTHRPIATMVDLLGSDDLSIEVSGTSVNILEGEFGFHTHAVHEKIVDAAPLAGLVEDPEAHTTRLDGSGKAEEVLAHYDIRKAKRERVIGYVAALSKGRGLMG